MSASACRNAAAAIVSGVFEIVRICADLGRPVVLRIREVQRFLYVGKWFAGLANLDFLGNGVNLELLGGYAFLDCCKQLRSDAQNAVHEQRNNWHRHQILVSQRSAQNRDHPQTGIIMHDGIY